MHQWEREWSCCSAMLSAHVGHSHPASVQNPASTKPIPVLPMKNCARTEQVAERIDYRACTKPYLYKTMPTGGVSTRAKPPKLQCINTAPVHSQYPYKARMRAQPHPYTPAPLYAAFCTVRNQCQTSILSCTSTCAEPVSRVYPNTCRTRKHVPTQSHTQPTPQSNLSHPPPSKSHVCSCTPPTPIDSRMTFQRGQEILRVHVPNHMHTSISMATFSCIAVSEV